MKTERHRLCNDKNHEKQKGTNSEILSNLFFRNSTNTELISTPLQLLASQAASTLTHLIQVCFYAIFGVNFTHNPLKKNPTVP